ncbi:hypothetical protein ACFFSY_21040 [Paenibacillus aurantiacus]|uniref:Uncharacterized protein n=1 Tax=Paenibacillus aurantiacus TaxID=1936118 RepID=A0ABV5KU84_9BACL
MISESIEAAIREAEERQRELLTIHMTGTERLSDQPAEQTEEQPQRALLALLALLDPRWDANSRKPSSKIRQDNEWRTIRASGGELVLASDCAADLFGTTPAAPAAKAFVRLISASRDLDELRRAAALLPEQTVLAFGAWLAGAANQGGLRVSLASPNGEFVLAELTEERVQDVLAYFARVEESAERLTVAGMLTSWDAGKRSYRIESSGNEYAGRADRKLKVLLQQLEASGKQPPLRAEAVIERRRAYREITGTVQGSDWLMELDTDIGVDPSETLYTLEDIAGRLRTLLESDDANYGGLGMTQEEFGAYAAQLEELRVSNPLKGALRFLDRQDVAQAADLMGDGRAISRWIGLQASSAAAIDDMDTASSARSRIASQLSRAASAAYPDLVALRTRLERMAVALRPAVEHRNEE